MFELTPPSLPSKGELPLPGFQPATGSWRVLGYFPSTLTSRWKTGRENCIPTCTHLWFSRAQDGSFYWIFGAFGLGGGSPEPNMGNTTILVGFSWNMGDSAVLFDERVLYTHIITYYRFWMFLVYQHPQTVHVRLFRFFARLWQARHFLGQILAGICGRCS